MGELTVAGRIRRGDVSVAAAERKVSRALPAEYPMAGLEPPAVVAADAGSVVSTTIET